ncbi:DnaD domain-containing protein [Salisediminibacterium beveridgei]|uniref:Chromosome replication initiation protein dnaD n=1 Tax=Salisediminibacterium beveridgei TaxID=632773 RepID=A0A1D7QV02_9BACI|nr:DnaD domain-containing protein [Salisediminibacterium beveridgei]AOM82842.1 Chromosome replication initiation protein dnaD [Salisediminibacterium beveridgei]
MNDEQLMEILATEPFSIPGLLFDHYHEIGLTDIQMMVLMQIMKRKGEGADFVSPDLLAPRMSMDEQQCAKILQQLLQGHLIEIVETKQSDGKIGESVSLLPVYRKLSHWLLTQQQNHEENDEKAEVGKLYERFEEEFARPLSPMELEMISMWLDDDEHKPFMIEAALRESVVSARVNFRYIDRILYDWKKKGIRTLDEARTQGEKVRGAKRSIPQPSSNQSKPSKQQHPGYDWLKGE